jgi:hypothetical protein
MLPAETLEIVLQFWLPELRFYTYVGRTVVEGKCRLMLARGLSARSLLMPMHLLASRAACQYRALLDASDARVERLIVLARQEAENNLLRVNAALAGEESQ